MYHCIHHGYNFYAWRQIAEKLGLDKCKNFTSAILATTPLACCMG